MEFDAENYKGTTCAFCGVENELIKANLGFGDIGREFVFAFAFCVPCLRGMSALECFLNVRVFDLEMGKLTQAIEHDMLRDKVLKEKHHSKADTSSKDAERRKMSNGLRFDILKRDGYKCVICGATSEEDRLEVDHRVPISKGGKTEVENLQTLCSRCNSGKYDKAM